MRFKITRGPTITKAVILTVVFGVIFLASASNLPSCSDPNFQANALTSGLLGGNGGGQCIERQSYLHTWSGWLAVLFLITAVVLWVIRYGASALKSVRAYGQEPAKTSGGAPPVASSSSSPASQAVPSWPPAAETMPEMGRTQPWQPPEDVPTRPDTL